MARKQDPKVEALSTIEVLAGASRRDLQEICSLTTEVRVRAGRVLCTQGAQAQEVFLVMDGSIAVSRDGNLLGVVGSGDIIGEMAMIDDRPRSATTVAVTDVTTLVLSTSEFRQLMQRFPLVADNIRAVNSRRTQVFAALLAA